MPFYKDRIFVCIFAVLACLKAAAFCGLYFFHPLGDAVLSFPDSLTYIYPAQTFLHYGTMWEAVSASPMLLRTPGYPFFLALVQLLCGNLTWAVAAIQNLLSLLMLIPVYLTARQLSGVSAARWASAFCAASVLYFSLSFAVLTETLCAFLLAWFVYVAIQFLARPRGSYLLLCAVLLAGAIYVRPAAYYFGLVAAVLFLGLCIGKLTAYAPRKILLFFVLPLVLSVGAWQLRNKLTTGFSGFTTVGAYNLYIWNEDFLAHKFKISVPEAHAALEGVLPAGFSELSPAEQSRLYKAMAWPLIKESLPYKLSRAPLWAAKTLLGTNFVHLSRLATGGHSAGKELDDQMLNQTSAIHSSWLQSGVDKLLFLGAAGEVLGVVFLGICGFWVLWKKHRAEAFFLAVYCLYFWGIGSTFFGAYARFRAPFEFVLCITAGIAVHAAAGRLKQRYKSSR